MSELNLYPVAKSLTRRHLVLGGERELVMSSLLLTAVLLLTAIAFEYFWFCVPIVLLQMAALSLFRSMAKRDAWLVQVWLQMPPDRILVGEVRGGEALTSLKAWTTGHPGGVATVHPETVQNAALRMQSLAAEAGGPTFADLEHFIIETLDLTIVITRDRSARRMVTDIGNHLARIGHA